MKRLLIIVVSCLVLSLTLLSSSRIVSAQSSSEWAPALGNIYKGVKLYNLGQNKVHWGTVIGWNDEYKNPLTGQKMRAVLVRMEADGSLEWKDREWLIKNNAVRKDDPALK